MTPNPRAGEAELYKLLWGVAEVRNASPGVVHNVKITIFTNEIWPWPLSDMRE